MKIEISLFLTAKNLNAKTAHTGMTMAYCKSSILLQWIEMKKENSLFLTAQYLNAEIAHIVN